MIYGYVRVSTKGQAKDRNSLEVQEKALIEAGGTEIYTDVFTGTKTDRPEFNKLVAKIGQGDTLIVAKLDRFARSDVKGTELVDILINKGVKIHILNMGIIDDSPTGKLIRMIMFAFAEFERDMIVERTSEGKAIAKQKSDFKEGRPSKFGRKQVEHALAMLATNSYRQVEELTGISKSTLIRAKKMERRAQICLEDVQ